VERFRVDLRCSNNAFSRWASNVSACLRCAVATTASCSDLHAPHALLHIAVQLARERFCSEQHKTLVPLALRGPEPS